MIKIKLFGSVEASEPKTEQNYMETSWCNLQCSGSSQIPSQNNLDDSGRFLSLYRVVTDYSGSGFALIIYDTENQIKLVETVYAKIILDDYTCITQLPTGEIFCYGNRYGSGTALIIDRSYGVRMLPSGTRCGNSTALYSDNNIYCFGGYRINGRKTALSRRFDLKNNRWINLLRLPEADSPCHSVIFNRKILISRCNSRKLWLYSIEIDSFSIIPYDFAQDKRKFLMNAERLYLIEWDYDGLIFESEDGYQWKRISKSGKFFDKYSQMYCLYNKEKIYISLGCKYYEFDLKIKVLLEIN